MPIDVLGRGYRSSYALSLMIMKINRITATPLRIRLKEPFRLAAFTVYSMHHVLIAVETDAGITGYGEATPSWDVNGETCESVVGFIRLITNYEMLGYSLIGEPIDSVQDVLRLMGSVIDPHEHSSMVAGNSAAKAGLEQALFHVVTQSTGKTLPELLTLQEGDSTPQGQIPCSTTISIWDIQETIDRVHAAIDAGSTTIRLKIGKANAFGHPGFSRDFTVIQGAHALITNQSRPIRLVADANQGFIDAAGAISFCKSIEGCLDWLEQPTLARDTGAFARIKQATTVPLMADESLKSYEDALSLLSAQAVDYFNVKLMKTGGILGALRLIDMATSAKVGCYIGSMIESALGVLPGLATWQLRPKCVGTDLDVFTTLAEHYWPQPQLTAATIQVPPDCYRGPLDPHAVKRFAGAYS